MFEIPKTASGYANTPTTLVSFCPAQANCTDGQQPSGGLIADAGGNLFGATAGGGAYGGGTVFEVAKTTGGYASTPTTLVSFCAQANCTDGAAPSGALVADASGNLFGITLVGGLGYGTVFEIAKTPSGYASTPTTLVSFSASNNANPFAAGLIADAIANLFGATTGGGAYGGGTVFEIPKTASGYASTPTTLVSFCAQANCTDGQVPVVPLIADAKGHLFGTTFNGGAYGAEFHGYGTAFEITGSGFIPPGVLAGTPGQPSCIGQSVQSLTQKYGGISSAAAALGYSVQDLQNEVVIYCGG